MNAQVKGIRVALKRNVVIWKRVILVNVRMDLLIDHPIYLHNQGEYVVRQVRYLIRNIRYRWNS